MIIIFGIPKTEKLSEEQFREVYEKYYNIVYKQLYYILRNNAISEEVCQEVFIKYYTINKNIEHVGCWLSKVATNMAFNYIRGHKRRVKREEEVFYKVEEVLDIADEFEIKEYRKTIKRLLLKLNDKQRTCLILKFSGYNYEEISQITNIPKNNISQLVLRGKQKIESLLEKEGERTCVIT